MRKNIRNYTSGADPQRSVQMIQETLSSHNAKSILMEYEAGCLMGMGFIIDTPKGQLPIKLPARIKQVEAAFLKSKKTGRYSRKPQELTATEKDQAYRTAWKNLYDWVDMQMTLLDLDMVKLEEIFLPYMATPSGQTFFEVMESRGFMLPAPSDSAQ